MKIRDWVIVTAVLVTASVAGHAGISGGGLQSAQNGAQLLLIGPVEAINPDARIAIVLGQKVLVGAADYLAVGETVAVFGTSRPDGSLVASKVQTEGVYVPGATPIFIAGTVQKVDASLGRVVVNGLSVDLTGAMASGILSPAVGSRVQITGTQPVGGGLVLVSGISGGGTATQGISGGGLVAQGISGGGTATQGISGGGLVAQGISGGGTATQGISGGGLVAQGISGGGTAALGISGGGK